MNNLWRVIILFMLPGVVWSGGFITAFFRLGDSDLESLKVITCAAVIAVLTAAVTMQWLQKVRRISSLYYPVCAAMALAFAVLPGVCRWGGFFNLYEGLSGMAIAGIAAAVLLQCFCSRAFNWLDRWSFVAGVLMAGWIVLAMCEHSRLSWLETLFFYLNELLLLTWLLASPLTLWGSKKRRWLGRLGLLFAAALSFIFTPQLIRSPRPEPPPLFGNSLWQKCTVTPQGNRYQWCDKNDNYGFFTYQHRLINWGNADEEIVGSLPGLLSTLNSDTPAIKMVVPVQSVLPDWSRELTGKTVSSITYWPESMYGSSKDLLQQLQVDTVPVKKRYDLLLITILNDNPYPGAVKRQLNKVLSEVKDDGVVAVSANLLRNASVFKTLHEKFTFCGVLPGVGRIWVFASRNLDLSPDAIDRNLNLLYGEKYFAPGDAAQLGQGSNLGWKYLVPPQITPLSWGGNSWLGSWLWLLLGGVLVIIWRAIRLLLERRGNMYSYCNSMENGFAGMGMFLLALSILVVNYGIMMLTQAVLVLLWSGCLIRLRCGGIWASLVGMAVFLWAAWSNCDYPVILTLIMLQSMLCVGQCQMYRSLPVKELRKMNCGAAWGAVGATMLLWAVWQWQIPLLLVWVLFAMARGAGIWQNEYKRVY